MIAKNCLFLHSIGHHATPVLCICVCLFCLTFARAEEIKFKTSDGCSISASYGAPAGGKLVFVNVHGLGSGKGEWAPFEKLLKMRGLGWLSLDLRGHGQNLSCEGQGTDYRTFSAGDWNAASKDIAAAVFWLKKRRISASNIVLCGASVGANLVLKAAAENFLKPAGVIMLSPGLTYAGVGIEEYFHRPLPFPLLLAASPDDNYAWQSSLRLVETAREAGKSVGKTIETAYSTGVLAAPSPAVRWGVSFRQGVSGHGVNMFSGSGEPLMEELAGMKWRIKTKPSSGE